MKLNGRAKVDGHGSKWAVIRLKVDGPLEKSKGRSGRSKSVKVDGPKVPKWTVKSVKVDGPNIF